MSALIIAALLAAGLLVPKPLACDVYLEGPSCIEIQFENPEQEFLFNNFDVNWAEVRESQYEPEEADPFARLVYEELENEPIISMTFVDDSIEFCFEYEPFRELQQDMSQAAWNDFMAKYLKSIAVRVIECVQARNGIAYQSRWHFGDADGDVDEDDEQTSENEVFPSPELTENKEVVQVQPPSPFMPPE